MQQLKLFDRDVRLIDLRRTTLGDVGERWTYNALERAGYAVAMGRKEHKGDLLAMRERTGKRWQVEVKTARRSKSGLWKFNLYKDDKHGQTDYRDSDVVILLAVMASGRPVVFVIPVCQINTKTIQFDNPEQYAGRWAGYRQSGRLSLERAGRL